MECVNFFKETFLEVTNHNFTTLYFIQVFNSLPSSLGQSLVLILSLEVIVGRICLLQPNNLFVDEILHEFRRARIINSCLNLDFRKS